MKKHLFLGLILAGGYQVAFATPSSTFWAPSTASCQAWKTPHVTYDSYFAKGPTVGKDHSPGYPTDTGLTIGLSPSNRVQAEFGFDLLYPTSDPLVLNGKLCTPESSLFEGTPGIGLGVYNVGLKKDVTDYNVAYFVVQKTISHVGGYVAFGVYHGFNKSLLKSSDGNIEQSGFLAAVVSPDIQIDLKGLKKINFVTDIQTGKNVLGGWGFGTNFYFSENVSLLTGPVLFFDRFLQPGQANFLWTTQLDIDIPFS